MPRNRWSFVDALDVERRESEEGQEREPRDADGPERDGLAAARAREPGSGQAHDLGGQRQRAQEADHRGARPEVERPADDHGSAGAGGEDLCGGSLGDGGVERAAQRPGRRVGLGDREGRGDASERRESDGGAERFHDENLLCTSRARHSARDIAEKLVARPTFWNPVATIVVNALTLSGDGEATAGGRLLYVTEPLTPRSGRPSEASRCGRRSRPRRSPLPWSTRCTYC